MTLASLMFSLGPLGIVMIMFLVSSIVPFPTEIIFMTAGALSGRMGLSYLEISLYCALGSALGGIFGYWVGKEGARPVLKKWGRFIGITPARLEAAEEFARKRGLFGLFLARLTPVVPFKIFSIASGIVELPFWGFVFLTFIGTIPRAYLFAAFGRLVRLYGGEMLLAAAIIVVLYMLFEEWRDGRKKASGGGRVLSRRKRRA